MADRELALATVARRAEFDCVAAPLEPPVGTGLELDPSGRRLDAMAEDGIFSVLYL